MFYRIYLKTSSKILDCFCYSFQISYDIFLIILLQISSRNTGITLHTQSKHPFINSFTKHCELALPDMWSVCRI